MPLWLKSTSAESRPKWLGGDGADGASGAKADCFATTAGWAMRAGQANSGNDNTSAQVEILACVSGATGSTLSATMGEANVLSVDWEATTTLAHDGTGTHDIVFTCDEALTVTSAAYATGFSGEETNSWVIYGSCVGPTDMAEDIGLIYQYYSGTGTNTITFRANIHANAVTDGYITLVQPAGGGTRNCLMVTEGSSAVVDGNGTTCTWADQVLYGGSAGGGVDHSTAIFGTSVVKTGSSVNTLTSQAGSSTGTALILTGVQFA